jgi:hypothetical protein
MSNMLYGVEQGYKLCNLDRNLEIDNRMYERNIPSAPLQANFSMRPVSTKYELLGITDRRAPATEPIVKYPTYNNATMFNPGTAQAPWSGFASNVNVESTLRNQFFALQSCDQAAYVPNTNSELYQHQVAKSSNTLPNEFQYLQRSQRFEPFNPNPCNLGKGLFMNHTRQQLKDL